MFPKYYSIYLKNFINCRIIEIFFSSQQIEENNKRCCCLISEPTTRKGETKTPAAHQPPLASSAEMVGMFTPPRWHLFRRQFLRRQVSGVNLARIWCCSIRAVRWAQTNGRVRSEPSMRRRPARLHRPFPRSAAFWRAIYIYTI